MRRRGHNYEDLAVQYLTRKGYRIIERNFHCGIGEIDVIAHDGDVLVFVEVKGSVNEEFGHPAERLTPKKLNRILECAYRFMEERGWDTPFRVDLIVVLGNSLEHYENVGMDLL